MLKMVTNNFLVKSEIFNYTGGDVHIELLLLNYFL